MAPRHYQHDLFCAFSTQAVVSSSHYNPSVLCCNGGTFFVVPETADSLRFQNIIVKRVCLECNIPQRTETSVRCGRPRSVWPDLLREFPKNVFSKALTLQYRIGVHATAIYCRHLLLLFVTTFSLCTICVFRNMKL